MNTIKASISRQPPLTPREGADAELCLIESEDNALHDQAVFAANYIEHAVAGGCR